METRKGFRRLYVEQYRLIQTLCGGTGVTDGTDIMDVTDTTDVTDIMNNSLFERFDRL